MLVRALTICIMTIWLSISEVSAVASMLWHCSSVTIRVRKSCISRL